jgi:hypothetical protein
VFSVRFFNVQADLGSGQHKSTMIGWSQMKYSLIHISQPNLIWTKMGIAFFPNVIVELSSSQVLLSLDDPERMHYGNMQTRFGSGEHSQTSFMKNALNKFGLLKTA